MRPTDIFLIIMGTLAVVLMLYSLRALWHSLRPPENVSKKLYKPTGFVYYKNEPSEKEK